MNNKKQGGTNYRNVHKSDHLGVVDILDLQQSGHNCRFQIKEVRQEFGVRVAGRKGDHNIAYFAEKGIKPWVLNAGSGHNFFRFTNSINVEDWAGLVVDLFIDPSVTRNNEVTGGIRIGRICNADGGGSNLPELTPDNGKEWGKAVIACRKNGGNLDAVLAHRSITPENQALIVEQANAAV